MYENVGFRLNLLGVKSFGYPTQAAGHRQVRLGQNPFQLGGSFVFGLGNIDRYTHISQTFGDNAQPAEMVAAIPPPSPVNRNMAEELRRQWP
jgi:hypothetical protein